MRCASELIQDSGVDAAYEAFHNDPRRHSGPTYIFAIELIPDGTQARSLLFPPNPAREKTPRGMFTDRSDQFGPDRQPQAVRIIEEFGGGWWYYAFANPTTGVAQPKATFILPVDWKGTPAFIGAGIYRRDFPGACSSHDVNAAIVEAEQTDGRLEEFVRCAALEVESKGYFATSEFLTDKRWNSGSIYIFALDLMGNHVFTGTRLRLNGVGIAEWASRGSPADQFGGRDVPAVGDTFGESYQYYSALNPATGLYSRKVSFVKRVTAHGIPILVGAGYYLD